MAFPYSYRKSVIFKKGVFKNKIVELAYIQKLLKDAILNKKPVKFDEKKQGLFFTFSAPILNFKYTTDLKINLKKEELNIDYEVNFESLIRIILIVIILTAFFSFLSVKYFLIASGLISILFFGVSFLTVDNFLENMIKKSIEDIIVDENIVEKLSQEQLLWINDENKCSACGEQLSEFDLLCPECGIKLKRSRYTVPLDVSKYKDRNITYHLKK